MTSAYNLTLLAKCQSSYRLRTPIR
ncbi:hypothetical protein [Vibrio jasicida]